MKTSLYYLATGIFLVLTGFCFAQNDAPLDRLTATFSDPEKPGEIEASVLSGGIKVTGYQGKEVIIETHVRSTTLDEEDQKEISKGLRRLEILTSGIEVEEENNKMQISIESMRNTVDLVLRVPVSTSLKLKCVNKGDLFVENVEGDFEVENINGKVTMANISGSVVAHALNKDLTVVFNAVNPQKSMSFSSLNGDIDVTLPAKTKADLKVKNDMGETFTDFEVDFTGKSQKTEHNNRQKGGKYRLHIDRFLYGELNGGGPEYQFTNFNGTIYIRSK